MGKLLYTDMMEFSTDNLAQAAYVSNAAGLEVDYQEYTTDGAAQAAYVSSDIGDSTFYLQLLNNNSQSVGDDSNEEYRRAWNFVLTESTLITRVDQYLNANIGTPTGQLTIKIETNNNNIPSGTLANANAVKAITTTASAWNNWVFAVPFVLSAGTYWVRFYCDDQGTSNSFRLAVQENGTTNGAYSNNGGSTWAPHSGKWYTSKVYTISLQDYSEGSIKNQGTYSLKVLAQATASLNDTLTKSGMSLNLSDVSELKIDLYASRTGTNIQIQIHDSGGTSSTKNITISSANTWETTVWDISEIANANKDNIDSIIIKIINADAINTFYVDNFRATESLQCYSEATIKQQGSYSLKILSTTGALNKTLTKTLTDYLDYSIQDVIKFDIRASRTGSNIKIQIHDVGGTTSEHTIDILSADTWQTETWILSAITSGDRDQIDKIIIKISNADASNTIYIDNLYTQVIVENTFVWIG